MDTEAVRKGEKAPSRRRCAHPYVHVGAQPLAVVEAIKVEGVEGGVANEGIGEEDELEQRG